MNARKSPLSPAKAECLALAALALTFAAAPARAGRWADLAAKAGATERDLGIRADRFETRLTLPSVEHVLDDPAAGYDDALAWGDWLSSASALSGPLALAADLVYSGPADEPPSLSSGPAISCPGAPAGVQAPLAALSQAVEEASVAARRAGQVFSEPERERLLASFGALATHRPLAAVSREDVTLAARFDQRPLVEAAAALAARVEAQLPALSAAAAGAPAGRWRCGGVLVGGTGDDVYSAADLAGVSLLVDLGGRNRYEGPLAAAGPGEARVAVDLGAEASFISTQPAFGSGLFGGIGLLYAPTPGRKSVEAGDFSEGAGFFGVGGALLAGAGLSARSGHFSQGAGEFGAGVFEVSGASASLSADYSAQGFGGTRGAGLLVARGDGLRADCGLRHPDGREPQAMISLCQGVGDGPRAYAAGGVGLALVDGAGARLRSSYFAQGAGYWHAFGALYARGDRSFAQARRYSQGAGVHAGAGLLSWRGSDGRLVNWGVGPAFGWDYGVGMLSLRGDRNAARADWASGEGDVNGRSLAEISGAGNLLRLPDWGFASFKRAAAGYALSRVSGPGTRLWSPDLGASRGGPLDAAIAPWGAAALEDGAALDSSVDVATAPWPAVDAAAAAADRAQDAAANARALAAADALPAPARVAAWLSIAAAESLDEGAAASAAGRLLSLPREEVRYVVRATSVEGFDAALWARLAAAAGGPEAAREAARELPGERGLRRALLVDLLRYGGARAAVPAALALLRDPDWRLRRAGAAELGLTLGQDGGEEPGRLRFLAQALALSRSTFTASSPQEAAAFKALGVKRLFDLYAVLSLDPSLSARDRLDLLWSSGSPFDPVPAATLRLFVDALRRGAAVYAPALRAELARSRALRPAALRGLRAAARDGDPDVRAAAFSALGQLGMAADAPALGAALSDRSTTAREAAAWGLGRLGAAARPELARLLSGRSPVVRRLAVLAAAQSGDQRVALLLRRGLADGDAGVRLASVAALSAVQPPYADAVRRALMPALERLAAGDPSPSVAASAARQLGRLGRD